MIAEDYVSYETAKLLKEKGFDADIDLWYNSDGEIFHLYHYDYNATKHFAYVQCPTLQMTMKWLREVHKLYCDIKIGDGDFVIDIISLKDGVFGCEVAEPESCVYPTYEKACEAAIKYCLENLI